MAFADLNWVCSCGAEFMEEGKSASPFMKYMKHLRDGRAKDGDDAHQGMGLRTADGELIAQTIRQAQQKGIIPKKNRKADDDDDEPTVIPIGGTPGDDDDDQEPAAPKPSKSEKSSKGSSSSEKSPVKGKLTYMQVNLPMELLVLHQLSLRVPHYSASFEEWLTDIAVGYYMEHPELGLYTLLGSNPDIQRALMLMVQASMGGEEEETESA